MAEARAERRLAAILATDVVGYSRLMGGDEEGTLAALKSLRESLIRCWFIQPSGEVAPKINTQADDYSKNCKRCFHVHLRETFFPSHLVFEFFPPFFESPLVVLWVNARGIHFCHRGGDGGRRLLLLIGRTTLATAPLYSRYFRYRKRDASCIGSVSPVGRLSGPLLRVKTWEDRSDPRSQRREAARST
jgi:hypothetical protein